MELELAADTRRCVVEVGIARRILDHRQDDATRAVGVEPHVDGPGITRHASAPTGILPYRGSQQAGDMVAIAQHGCAGFEADAGRVPGNFSHAHWEDAPRVGPAFDMIDDSASNLVPQGPRVLEVDEINVVVTSHSVFLENDESALIDACGIDQ